VNSLRRVRRLGRLELILFGRNRTALFTALVVPLVSVAFFASFNDTIETGLDGRAFLLSGMLGLIILFVVYFNLVAAYVARREELVLKRLRTGECTDSEILVATAVPAVAVTLIQSALAVLAGAIALGLPVPVNPVVLLAGLVAGIALFALLAAVSAAFTRTVELAQVSTTPLLLVCTLGSGLILPVGRLPDPVAGLARFLPLTPVVDLIRLGWLGTAGEAAAVGFWGAFAAAAGPFAILAGWLVLGTYGQRRWFRWEPRP
jgi:ABC-2 type transport system permease protein